MIYKMKDTWSTPRYNEIEYDGDVIVICHCIKNQYITELNFGGCILRNKFSRKHQAEYFLGSLGIERIEYHSSNGEVTNRILKMEQGKGKYKIYKYQKVNI